MSSATPVLCITVIVIKLTKDDADAVVSALAQKIIDNVSPSRLVIGLSGGADSTLALLICARVRTIMKEQGRSCFVQAVHCIHGLDADDPIWLAHCQRLCRRVQVDLVTPRLNIIYGNGRSPEEISRSERYSALLNELREGVLILGHQADDQTENLLLALKRGSGPRGLSGMRFLTRDKRGLICRPLLELTKTQIEDIIEALGFDFVYDISNSYLKFERNFIRLKVLPLLRTRFAGVDSAILRSAKLCGDEHDLAMRYVKTFYEKCVDLSDPYLLKLCFKTLDLNDEALMLSLLRMFSLEVCELPPELNVLQEILNLMKEQNDQKGIIKLENYEVRRFRDHIYILSCPVFPERMQYQLSYGKELVLGSFSYVLNDCGLAEVVLDFNLHGQERLKPVGRHHSRELKKLFSEYDVPYFLRAMQCVVRDGAGTALGVGDLFCCDCEKINTSLALLSIKRIG